MISIITPTYNRASLIRGTIESVLRQTCQSWELIVVDDGSTDNTPEVMKDYLADPRIRYYQKPNSGQADTNNYGSGFAQGEFITFLDSDDEAYPEWLETVQKHIDDNVGLLSCEANRRFADGKMVRESFNEIRFMGKKLKLKFTCGSFFIRRTLFEDVGGYDISLKSNIQTDLGYRLLIRLLDTNHVTVAVPEPLVQINIHAGLRIRTNWSKMVVGGEQFLNKHFDLFRKYDKEVISLLAGSIGYYYYKMKKRRNAISYTLKAIRYDPFRWGNYLRVVRYMCF